MGAKSEKHSCSDWMKGADLHGETRLMRFALMLHDRNVEGFKGFQRRDKVVGHNCRFMQGPGTDQAELARLRSAIKDEKPMTVSLITLWQNVFPHLSSQVYRASFLTSVLRKGEYTICTSSLRGGGA